MRKLLLVLLVLLALGAMPASAAFVPNVSYDSSGYAYFDYFVYNATAAYVVSPDEAGVTAFCTALGHGTHLNQGQWRSFDDNNTMYGGAGFTGYSTNITLTTTAPYTAIALVCDGNYHWARVGYKDTNVTPISANFTGVPTSGAAPIYVSFTDTSDSAPFPVTSWNWSISPATGWMANPDTLDDEDVTILFTANGNYTITHGASNGYNSDIDTKTDYIQILNSSALATTHAVARDLYTGFAIHGANVDMFDVENGSWTNTTASPNGQGSITTLASHHINIWGSAAGYNSDNLQNVAAVDGGYYTLLLRPANITTTNVSAGNLTLFVTVQELPLPHNTVSGAEVTAAWGANYASGITNNAGSVSFTVPNNTAIYLSAFKTGFASGSKSYITGSANGGSATETTTMYLGTDYVTPTPSVTTLPGGGTPTPTLTLLPGCEDPMSAECQASQNNYSMGWLSQNGLGLIQFFVICFIIFMMKGMGRK